MVNKNRPFDKLRVGFCIKTDWITTSSEERVENSDFTQRPSDDVDKDSYPY